MVDYQQDYSTKKRCKMKNKTSRINRDDISQVVKTCNSQRRGSACLVQQLPGKAVAILDFEASRKNERIATKK
jgi:hypothetical protein